MNYLSPVVAMLGLVLLAAPALAQLSPNGSGNPSGLSNPTQLQPKASQPDVAPPALPGAVSPLLATGPNLQKPGTGDPTAALFAAVNNADYNAAQDAVSRGADINAQNSLGETPLDLSIALNRNNITFMLLSARNEGAEAPSVASGTPVAVPSVPVTRKLRATPVKMVAPMRAQPPSMAADDPGTPNPNAGFLGFGPTK